VRKPLDLPDVYGCLDEFMEELSALRALLLRVQVEHGDEYLIAGQVKDLCAKYIGMLSR